MTAIMFILGVLLFAISGRFVARAIAVPRLKLRQHLTAIDDYGFASEPEPDAAKSRARLNERLTAFAHRVGKWAIDHVTALPPLERGHLASAGFYETTPEAVHGYRALAALLLAGLVLLAASSGGLTPLAMVVMLAAAALGWQLPATVIKSRGRARLEEIDKELPDLIDLLIATVEAGMGFAASLALVAGRLQGALGEELLVAVRQQNLGISTSEALDEMLERCDTQSMRAFVRTITRSESMGLSIGPILRELATDMRRRRRQATQEKMHKAPIKMLFPMMFLIMPALFIVLFYPAVHSVMTTGFG
ncbi:MAG TPA: type II secretion system F family protein [Solirubrobacteraceae bacterium]|jgi:tight adherence protein C|nr:type II secretion system F family protein [Solirubrobacteraceae bacterium]